MILITTICHNDLFTRLDVFLHNFWWVAKIASLNIFLPRFLVLQMLSLNFFCEMLKKRCYNFFSTT